MTSEPYIGPRPFERSDRDVFFGRSREVSELVSLITAHSEVLLYGQSGAGKTSLVKAGLIHALVNDEGFNVLPPMRVRENVAAGLRPPGVKNVYMFNALSSISKPDQVDGLAGVSLEEYLLKYKESAGNGDANCPTIIIFDQFEELFTFYPEHWEDRKDFFKQVRHALKEDPLLRVLFSMREDFIAELDPYVNLLPEKMRIRFRVERLREKTALGAVIQPLEKVQTDNGKRHFAPNVAEKLVNNLLQVNVKTPDGIKRVKGEFVEALQLQVVCQALWQNLKADDALITEEDLEAFGDVDKALAQFYENAITKTAAKTGIKERRLRQWFERTLITPTGTRGTVFRGEKETGGIPNAVVDELENQRIIRMELRGGAQWYEITHDRFVETVQTSNHKWILSRPSAEEFGNRMEEKASNWDQAERSNELLLDEVELRLAEDWLQAVDTIEIEPSRNLIAFVRESKHQIETKRKEAIEEKERMEQQARTARLFRKLTLAVGLLSIVGLVASVLAGWQWRVARSAANNARIAANDAFAKQVEAENAKKTLEETYKELTHRDTVIRRATILREGYAFRTEGKLDDAEKKFQELIADEAQGTQGTDPQPSPVQQKIAGYYLTLADISLKRGHHSTAIGRYDIALDTYRKLQSTNALGQTLLRKAELYFDWGRRKQKSGDNAEAAKKFKHTLEHYKEALKAFQKTRNNPGMEEAKTGIDEATRRLDEIASLQNPQSTSP